MTHDKTINWALIKQLYYEANPDKKPKTVAVRTTVTPHDYPENPSLKDVEKWITEFLRKQKIKLQRPVFFAQRIERLRERIAKFPYTLLQKQDRRQRMEMEEFVIYTGSDDYLSLDELPFIGDLKPKLEYD